MRRVVRVGSRESRLAVTQAELVISSVKRNNPDIKFELVTIKTTGDKILDKTLDKIGGKGLFIKELEQSLLDGKIDIAVHSYKDMPYIEGEELPVVALSERESPFDALVLPRGADTINSTKPVGSSSLRRSIQFTASNKGFETTPIRGNVLTRLDKLDCGQYSAIILAYAGLNRLNIGGRASKVFTADEMIPAASQGILAVQGIRGGDYSYLSDFHSKASEYASRAERRFLKTLGVDCGTPAAAYAELHGNEIKLRGFYADCTEKMVKGVMRGSLDKADRLGEELALSLKKRAVEEW